MKKLILIPLLFCGVLSAHSYKVILEQPRNVSEIDDGEDVILVHVVVDEEENIRVTIDGVDEEE